MDYSRVNRVSLRGESRDPRTITAPEILLEYSLVILLVGCSSLAFLWFKPHGNPMDSTLFTSVGINYTAWTAPTDRKSTNRRRKKRNHAIAIQKLCIAKHLKYITKLRHGKKCFPQDFLAERHLNLHFCRHVLHVDNRDLKQSGLQRWRRRRTKSEFVFLVKNGATPLLKHKVCKQCWVQNGILDNLSPGFPFSDHENFGDFTSSCRGRLRNVQSFKTYVLSYFSSHQIFCFSTSFLR